MLLPYDQKKYSGVNMNWKKLLLVGIASVALPVTAQQYCCDYYDCCEEECFELYGDWLYWTVRECDLSYVWDTPVASTSSAGPLKAVDPDFTSGFRIGVIVPFCDWEFAAHYTCYDNCESDRTRSDTDTLFGTRLIVGTTQDAIDEARSKYDVDFNQFDLEFGRTFRPQYLCNTEVRTFGGARFAWIDRKLDTVYLDTATPRSTTIHQKVDNDLYGLYVGMGSETTLMGCFSLFGDFSVGAFAVSSDQSVFYQTLAAVTETEYDITSKNYYCAAANVNLSLGMGYTFCGFCDSDVMLAIGYEFHNWINLPGFISPQEVIAAERNLQLDQFSGSLGFDGLFVRLAVSF